VQEIVQDLAERFDGQIDESAGVKEDIAFAAPVSLRVLRDKAG